MPFSLVFILILFVGLFLWLEAKSFDQATGIQSAHCCLLIARYIFILWNRLCHGLASSYPILTICYTY